MPHWPILAGLYTTPLRSGAKALLLKFWSKSKEQTPYVLEPKWRGAFAPLMPFCSAPLQQGIIAVRAYSQTVPNHVFGIILLRLWAVLCSPFFRALVQWVSIFSSTQIHFGVVYIAPTLVHNGKSCNIRPHWQRFAIVHIGVNLHLSATLQNLCKWGI